MSYVDRLAEVECWRVALLQKMVLEQRDGWPRGSVGQGSLRRGPVQRTQVGAYSGRFGPRVLMQWVAAAGVYVSVQPERKAA